MSEILNWATLDNSDVITFQESGDGTYWVLNGENQIAKPSGRYDKEANTWEMDGIVGGEKEGAYKVWKTGVYGLPSGNIKKLKIYFKNVNSSSNYAIPSSIAKLAVGYCRGPVATIKTFAFFESTDIDTSENTITFTLETPLPIDGDYINEITNGLAIIPIFEVNGVITPDVEINQEIGSITTYANGIADVRKLEVKSFIRSTFEAGSSLINGGNSSSQEILKMTVTVDIDGAYDHIRSTADGGNFNSYHLDNSTISGLKSLKYYAPIIVNNTRPKNYKFRKLFISHDSLSLGNNIKLNGKKIQSLQIPINVSDSWANGRVNFSRNPRFRIGNGQEPTTWCEADTTLAIQDISNTEIIWTINFLKNSLVYTGNGITITLASSSDESAVRSYEDAASSVSSDGSIDKIVYDSNTYNFTPEIRVIFDFDGRSQFMEMLYRKISALS